VFLELFSVERPSLLHRAGIAVLRIPRHRGPHLDPGSSTSFVRHSDVTQIAGGRISAVASLPTCVLADVLAEQVPRGNLWEPSFSDSFRAFVPLPAPCGVRENGSHSSETLRSLRLHALAFDLLRYPIDADHDQNRSSADGKFCTPPPLPISMTGSDIIGRTRR